MLRGNRKEWKTRRTPKGRVYEVQETKNGRFKKMRIRFPEETGNDERIRDAEAICFAFPWLSLPLALIGATNINPVTTALCILGIVGIAAYVYYKTVLRLR